jgi:hypothetical protein
MRLLVAIFAGMRRNQILFESILFSLCETGTHPGSSSRGMLRSKTPWQNKKAGANAGPLQLPCKLDQ